jgi:hypothetical protein
MEHVSDLDVPRVVDYVCLLAKPCFSRSINAQAPLPTTSTSNVEASEKQLESVQPFERATLEHRYPETDHSDFEFPGEVLDLFCFPSTYPCAVTPEPHPFFSTFILTDASGHRTYVSSLQWLAREHNDAALCYKCLCLIGRIPLYSLHEAVLLQTFALLSVESTLEAYQQNVPIAIPERIINHLIYAAPVPGNREVISIDLGSHRFYYGLGLATGGKKRRNISLPHVDDAMFNVLFHMLSPDTIVSIVENLLQEKRVLFHSSKCYRLTTICEALASLLFPFDWSHVFIPVLPHDLLHYLEAPMPYIIGVHSTCIGSPEWEDLSDDQMPNIIVDIDRDRIKMSPPPTDKKNSGVPRPPPTGFNKKRSEGLKKEIYRLVPVSNSHCDSAHYHDTSTKSFYRSPVTGLRYDFNPRRANRIQVPAILPMNDLSSNISSSPSMVAVATVSSPSSLSPSIAKTPSNASAPSTSTTPFFSPPGTAKDGDVGTISSMFVQGIHTEKTILCGGVHHRWIDEVRVSFLRAVVSILVDTSWDIRVHVNSNNSPSSRPSIHHGPPPFNSKLFLSQITDNSVKPLARRLLETQMFVQFMGSLTSTSENDKNIVDMGVHALKKNMRPLGRSERSQSEFQSPASDPNILSSNRKGIIEQTKRFKQERDEGEEHHVHLWSVLQIAVELNKTGSMYGPPVPPAPQQEPPPIQARYGPRPVTRPPPPPRTPDGGPGSIQPPSSPKPPPRPPPTRPSLQQQQQRPRSTDTPENTNNEDDYKKRFAAYKFLMKKLCRPNNENHPVKIFHETDENGIEIEEKNGMIRNGITLLKVPMAPSHLITSSETDKFKTHTCLWGHYKLRGLVPELYGPIPEEEEFINLEEGTTNVGNKSDQSNSGDQEGGVRIFDENMLSPSAIVDSTKKVKKNPRRRRKNSFRQKGKMFGSSSSNSGDVSGNDKGKVQRRGPGSRIKSRRHSTFAAIGTNDLSYYGVTANKFAEIQSSIWSQVLPTMGKVTSKRVHGRRFSMIGSAGSLPMGVADTKEDSEKEGNKKKPFAGAVMLQKMMAKHEEEAKVDNSLNTPKKQLLRGSSVQMLVGNKTTVSMLRKGVALQTPLRSNLGGSGGTKGKFGMTPAKSVIKTGGGSKLRLRGHNKSLSTMSSLNWSESVVSPSMNHLIQKRLYNLSIDNVKALGKERLRLKQRLVELEKTMKAATATAMVRHYQLKRAKGFVRGQKQAIDVGERSSEDEAVSESIF